MWRNADLSELIRDQLLHGALDVTRVTAFGPPLSLEAQAALHMALMLHELGTNAMKYGALSVPAGWVAVRWTVEDHTLRLRWEERGGPPMRVPTKRGFGTTLIEQSAKGGGGSARMLAEVSGVVWEITLPLPYPIADATRQLPPRFVGSEVAGLRTHVADDKPPGMLAGKRFLVVEDEPLVALDLAEGLKEAGAEVAASVGSAKEALDVIETGPLDAALLDANLHGRPVDAIAAALTRHNIPFVFVTGYGREALPHAFREATVLSKPFGRPEMLEAAARLIEPRVQVRRLRER